MGPEMDADFILHEDYVPFIKNLIEELDEKRWYFVVYWPHICLDGDLFHFNTENFLYIEHWLFTYHPRLKYVMLGWLVHLDIPWFYKRIDIDKPMSMHLELLKPGEVAI